MRKLVVAVIDSGVNCKDSMFENLSLTAVKYIEHKFMPCTDDSNGHGTEIVKIIYSEEADVVVISIQILDENNKGKLSELCAAIRYCIQQQVDVINLSLGFTEHEEIQVKELEEICKLACQSGIVIFAANTNQPGKKSYPANFSMVVEIDSQQKLDNYITIDKTENRICFSNSYVYVPNYEETSIRHGNSYLVAYITGLFCRFMKSKSSGEKIDIQLFYSFLNQELAGKLSDSIFYNKDCEKSLHLLDNCRVAYISSGNDSNDNDIFEFYRNRACMRRQDLSKYKDDGALEELKDTDYLFFGNLPIYVQKEYRSEIERLIKYSIRKQIHIMMVVPLLSTFARIRMREQYQINVISMYK